MNYPLYNSTLCPDLWDKKGELYVMRKEVRERLMKIADDFVVEYLAEAKVKIKVKDVVVIGSIANFNWNKFSDIDLHLVFDYADLDMSEEDAFTMLTAIKINWNKSHDIKIKGHDLELGVQGLEQENHSKSTYSVKRNKWLVPPTNVSPKFDKETIKAKHNMMKEKIDALLKAKDDDGLRRILEKLYVMRQAGLDKSGEYSAENIVFKILRAQGYLDKIKDHAAQIYDKEMTLNEIATNLPNDRNYTLALYQFAAMINSYTDKHGKYPTAYPVMLQKLGKQYEVDASEVYSDMLKVMRNSSKEYQSLIERISRALRVALVKQGKYPEDYESIVSRIAGQFRKDPTQVTKDVEARLETK